MAEVATFATSDQLLIVIDPAARRTDAESVRIAKDVLSAGAATKVCLPEGPEEFARVLARRGSRRPVVVGDDRALMRAVSLLHRQRELAGCALSMVPVGGGLSLAGALGVPTGAVAAARAVLDGVVRRMDLLVDDSDGVVLGALRIPPLAGGRWGVAGSAGSGGSLGEGLSGGWGLGGGLGGGLRAGSERVWVWVRVWVRVWHRFRLGRFWFWVRGWLAVGTGLWGWGSDWDWGRARGSGPGPARVPGPRPGTVRVPVRERFSGSGSRSEDGRWASPSLASYLPVPRTDPRGPARPGAGSCGPSGPLGCGSRSTG
jgi:hypothetical protein